MHKLNEKSDKVVVIVQNSLGKLFVHQRGAKKKTFPLLYGLGAGGCINPGETPHQAAERELREELGIKAKPKSLFNIYFKSKNLSHEVHVFYVKYDTILKSSKEFQWSGWLDITEVDKLARGNKLCPDTKLLYEKWREEYKN